MQSPSVPLPVDIGYCTDCRADVEIDARGRCACGLLAIWRSDRPRPSIVTEHLLVLRDADRIDRSGKEASDVEAGVKPGRQPRIPGGAPCITPERRLGAAMTWSPCTERRAAPSPCCLSRPRAAVSTPAQHETPIRA